MPINPRRPTPRSAQVKRFWATHGALIVYVVLLAAFGALLDAPLLGVVAALALVAGYVLGRP